MDQEAKLYNHETDNKMNLNMDCKKMAKEDISQILEIVGNAFSDKFAGKVTLSEEIFEKTNEASLA